MFVKKKTDPLGLYFFNFYPMLPNTSDGDSGILETRTEKWVEYQIKNKVFYPFPQFLAIFWLFFAKFLNLQYVFGALHFEKSSKMVKI